MTIDIGKMRHDMRWETRRFVVQIVPAFAAAIGAGSAIGRFAPGH